MPPDLRFCSKHPKPEKKRITFGGGLGGVRYSPRAGDSIMGKLNIRLKPNI